MCKAQALQVVVALAFLFSVVVADEPPKVLDPRLKLELIAESPIVRTPTGIAIDEKGRVYVIESHTHFPPANYDGPKADRILRFEEKDGKWTPSVFFEGTTHTMGCGFHPDGSLYVATRMEIFKLNDKDDDGKISADERTNLVKHDTAGNYPHNGLSGFAFDFAGNVYFGQGENLGAAYKIIGSDGATIAGGGEGGNIYCVKADGSKLRRVATGFWNPFHMCMDPYGRLFAVDNDPDSRPPCRLIHVVEGGDYGYRFRNGRKGLHPFTSWNGELPGTLPMVAGTGEAPSGMLSRGTELLVTSWGDHRLESYRLEANGASFTSNMKPLVLGDDQFRPVGIAKPDTLPHLFITDWVDKSYQLHGKGRLWCLYPENRNDQLPRVGRREDEREWREQAANPANLLRFFESIEEGETGDMQSHYVAALLAMAPPDAEEIKKLRTFILTHTFHEYEATAAALGGSLGVPPKLEEDFEVLPFTDQKRPGEVRYAATRRLDPTKHRVRLLELVADEDPFIQHAARYALEPAAEELASFAFDKESRTAVRLGVALVIRASDTAQAQERIPELLADANPRVRFVAIQWIGEEKLNDIWATVKDDVEKRATTRQELEAIFATSALLEKYDPGKESRGEEFIVKMLLDPKTSKERQAFLLRMLRADHPAITEERLKTWFEGGNAELRLAALQIMSQRGSAPKFLDAEALAGDDERPLDERLEVIGLLKVKSDDKLVDSALKSNNKLLISQVARSLRGEDSAFTGDSRPQLNDWLPPTSSTRPSVEDQAKWQKNTSELKSDPKSGELIFHHAIVGCNKCHEANGRGAAIGPNLTGIGKQISRERLLSSILTPSKEIAPQFALWEIETKDGKIQKGMYFDEEVDGTVIYADEQGKKFKVHPRDVESRTQQQKSIMPDGLAYRLTDQELADLLAFLGSDAK